MTPEPPPAGPAPWAAPQAGVVQPAWAPPAWPVQQAWPAPARPVQPTWQGPPSYAPQPRSETGLSLPWALGVTAAGLLLSFLLSRYAGLLGDRSQQVDMLLRRALFVTLLFYLAVGMALLVLCQVKRVGLVWTRQGIGEALLLGLPTGALGGLIAVGLQSLLRGRLASDPRVELLVGGGGALRIGLVLVVLAVLAPLVEETLFRGILGGTLLARGLAPALLGSAAAFSVWHMSPAALRYYVYMGLALGALWHKRGLVGSMAAHAAFNGVLVVAAVSATTAGGHLVRYDGLSVHLPGGWHESASARFGDELLAAGPGGAALSLVRRQQSADAPDDAGLVAELQARPQLGTLDAVPGTVRLVQLPVGEVVEADVLVRGQRGHLLRLSSGSSSYVIVVVTGGSPAAEHDWDGIARSLQLVPGAS